MPLSQRPAELIAAQSDLRQLPMNRDMEISQLRSQVADLIRQQAAASSDHSYEVKTPIAGKIDLALATWVWRSALESWNKPR